MLPCRERLMPSRSRYRDGGDVGRGEAVRVSRSEEKEEGVSMKWWVGWSMGGGLASAGAFSVGSEGDAILRLSVGELLISEIYGCWPTWSQERI